MNKTYDLARYALRHSAVVGKHSLTVYGLVTITHLLNDGDFLVD